MNIVICDKCEGTGQLCHDVGTHNSEYEYEPCPVCTGTGRLIKEVTIDFKPFIPGPNISTRIF